MPTQAPFQIGSFVRVKATGAIGTVVEVSHKDRWVDVDLGDGIVAEFDWDEVIPMPTGPKAQA